MPGGSAAPTPTGQLSSHTDLEALAQLVFALVPGYLMQKRIIGDINPERCADAIAVLLASAES